MRSAIEQQFRDFYMTFSGCVMQRRHVVKISRIDLRPFPQLQSNHRRVISRRGKVK